MTRASDTAKLIGAGATILDGTTISTADNTDSLILTSTDADASNGPNLNMFRNSSSPADNDFLGNVKFNGRNDNSQDVQYSEIEVYATDVSDGTEDGLYNVNVMTGGSNISYMQLKAGSGAVFNEDSNDIDFRVESNSNANMLFVDAGNDAVGINNSSPATDLDVTGNILTSSALYLNSLSVGSMAYFSYGGGNPKLWNTANGALLFGTNNTERMRIHSGGAITVGTTETNVMTVDGRHGIVLHNNTVNAYAGVAQFSANGSAGIRVNRDADDGNLVVFRQNASQEGTISVSGSTVSYNAFSGSHWSRLSDNSKPTILKGTVIETIDEMCDWYQARFEIQEEGETRTVRQSIALPSDASVGDTLTVTFEDNSYTATIIKEEDNKHTKCKISDTADSTRVYGVFANWDNDDDTVNDMYVTAVGTHVVRVHSSATVSAGDLLTSNGDGTAKVQDDDIIRSKTIGKVLTNIKQETYSDGSYTVPCALYCG